MAVFEALKGVLVILVGLGLLAFVHYGAQDFAERLVAHFHLNPARHYPRIFIEAARQFASLRLRIVAAGAFAYSTFRFVEAYGLWHGRAWGQWIGILSGSVYVPAEVVALIRRPTPLKAILLALNLLLIAYLSVVRYRQSRRTMRSQECEGSTRIFRNGDSGFWRNT